MWLKLVLPFTGLAAFLWFLVRVIPKPSRATYPCQRVAFPLACSFIVWFAGLLGSVAAFRKAKACFVRARYAMALALTAASVCFIWGALNTTADKRVSAEPRTPQPVNDPIGVAKGIYPGRVVWVHDPNATDWAYTTPGQSEHWYEDEHTNQAVVNAMLSRAIRSLSAGTTDAAAWDAVFRHFNLARGKGDVGYTPGEKIAVKINFTLTYGADPCLMDKVSDPGWGDWYNWIDNSPQLSISLLKQLTGVVGVEPCDITIGDPGRIMPNYWYDMVEANCPGVVYLARVGGKGRTQATWSDVEFYWSDPDPEHWEGVTEQDHIPTAFAQADYLIDFAILKSHSDAGITLCGKNLYGALLRNPSAWEMPNPPSWYSMHWSRILPNESPGMGRYRAIVDLMGHPQLGGKTLLCLVDGLFAGEWWNGVPVKWNMPPFNGDWPSSIFLSQDSVSIDSVCFDFLLAEWPKDGDPNVGAGTGPNSSGADDYLHEAALADAPPSGTVYDPNNDGVGLASLGVHEHWNNSTDKQYSRNLLTGSGIELVTLPLDLGAAYDPRPGSGAVNVDLRPTLTWKPGDYVAYGGLYKGAVDRKKGNGHHVFLDTHNTYMKNDSAKTLLNYPIGTQYGHIFGAQDSNYFSVETNYPGGFKVNTVYYWCVIEVNDKNAPSGEWCWKSQIWQFRTVSGKAKNPSPANNSTLGLRPADALQVTLAWTPGYFAAAANGHQVYFGTDYNEVNGATSGYTVRTDPNYLATGLKLGWDYYWRVDEVNGATTWKGDVWKFTVGSYRVIDEFTYNNDAELHAKWNDWWNDGYSPDCSRVKNGSLITNDKTNGAMSYQYDNNDRQNEYGDMNLDRFSEVKYTFTTPADWSYGDPGTTLRALVVRFKGSSANDANATWDRMYAGVEDSAGNVAIVPHENPDAQKAAVWDEWNIDLKDFNNAGVNLSNVKYVYLGFGVRCNSSDANEGGDGTVLFDYLRLYPPRCVGEPLFRQLGDITGGPGNNLGDCVVDVQDLVILVRDWLEIDYIMPLQNPDDTNLVAQWDFDNQTYDNNDNTIAGNLADGTPVGDANVVYDAELNSYVLSLPQNDSNDYVDCGGGDPQIWGHLPNSFTLCAWVNQTQFQPWGCFVTKGEYAWKLQTLHTEPVVHFATHQYGWISATSLKNNNWYHVAGVYDADYDYILIYINGEINGGTGGWPEIYDDWDWANVLIGARHTPYFEPQVSSFFKGRLDDVRIYNRVLWQPEIKYLATHGAATWYYPVTSPANIYDAEPMGQRTVNFRDFAVLAEDWLESQLWPADQ